jgi:hypothetical protein
MDYSTTDGLLANTANNTDNFTNTLLPCNYLRNNNLTEQFKKQCEQFSISISIVTEVSVGLVVLFLILLVILKILSTSRDSMLSANKYDLILFKDQSQNNTKKKGAAMNKILFDNSEVRAQNLKLLQESGFDDSVLKNKFGGGMHKTTKRRIK